MKKFKISIVVLLCSIVALTSCEEESITPDSDTYYSSNSIKKKKANLKDGGEEEDWIIIYGVVQTSSSSPIGGAEVILFDENFDEAHDTVLTNSLGEFNFQNDTNSYTFKVSKEGYETLTTIPFEFPESSPITLNLIEE